MNIAGVIDGRNQNNNIVRIKLSLIDSNGASPGPDEAITVSLAAITQIKCVLFNGSDIVSLDDILNFPNARVNTSISLSSCTAIFRLNNL